MANRTLKVGDAGDDVASIQRRLGVTADGKFGPGTQAAVINFQTAAGLAADGIVGPATWERLGKLGASTAAPAPVTSPDDIDAAGWYGRAKRVDAHPNRIGAAIAPRGFVFHTTDMLEDTFDGLVRRTAGEGGDGAGYHWLIGRSPAQGVIQMTSAYRNGNHAGGSKVVNGQRIPWHGNLKLADGTLVHPNTWYLGCEVHNGGYLGRRTAKGFVHRDSGRVVPDDDVFVDSRGIGWHKITPYQFDQLARLWAAARKILKPIPAGAVVMPNGTYAANGALWATTKTPQLLGHVTFDPNNKTDPGPQGIDWINAQT